MTTIPPGDRARVTVSVAAAPAEVFRIFTEEIDRWWLRGLKYRLAGKRRGIIHLEPRAGGRLFESFDTAAGAQVQETGRVTVWDPPSRLVFDWRAANFRDDQKTEVEVCFEPTDSGTLVTLTHRGWSLLPGDHPVRHGKPAAEFIRSMGMWWGELLSSLRQHAAQSS